MPEDENREAKEPAPTDVDDALNKVNLYRQMSARSRSMAANVAICLADEVIRLRTQIQD
jgi:hypothetical protein